LAGVLTRIVGEEITYSKRITLEEYAERSWWRRLVHRLAWSLCWWL
jgi:hypothetical protein